MEIEKAAIKNSQKTALENNAHKEKLIQDIMNIFENVN